MCRVVDRLLAAMAAVAFIGGGYLLPAMAQATSGGTPPPIVHYHHTDGAPATNTAHWSPGNPAQSSGIGTGVAAASTIRPPRINLDLSSTSSSSRAGNFVGTHPVSITLGGASISVTPGMSLTSAERVALSQVLQTGTQSIILGSQGNAVGGTLTIGPRLSQRIASLVIPQGVTVIDNDSRGTALNLTGNLTNSGTLYVLSTNPLMSSAAINANNIYNQQGGLLSSVLPSSGLAGYSGASNALHLTLNAVNDIVNAGVISSSGNLTVNAGGAIANVLPSGLTGAQPIMQAQGSLSLNSGAGNIVNSGLMSATAGNIDFASQSAGTFAINNSGGTLQALQGSINLRDQSYAGMAATTLSGGDVLSKSLNVYAGEGSTDISVGQLTGVVNSYGNAVHVIAETDNLALGDINLSGDPTFYNDQAGGGITINGNITVTEDLTIVADGSISTSGTGDITITTSGSGGHINIIAGASISTGSCSGCSAQSGSLSGTFSNGGGNVPAGQSITLNGPSAGGGNIDFTSITGTNSITLDVSNSGGAAGSIALIAAQGTTSHSGGLILMPNSTLNTTGDSALDTGTVVIAAGGTNGTNPSIEVQNITARTITLETAQVGTLTNVTVNGNGHISTTAIPTTYQPSGEVEVVTGGAVSGTAVFVEASELVNNGAISSTSSGITVQDGITTGPAGVTISGTGTFTTPSNEFVTFESGTDIIFDSGMSQTINGGGLVKILTPLLEANTGSTAVLNAASGLGFFIRGDEAATGTTDLTFGSVGGAATIELDGAPITITSKDVTITSGTTLQSNNNFTMNLTNPGVATFTLNGTLKGTATGDTILISGAGALTMTGTPQNAITVPNGAITVQAQGNNALTFAANYTIGHNDDSSILIASQSSGGSVVIGSSVTLTLESDKDDSSQQPPYPITIATPTFVMDSQATLAQGFATITPPTQGGILGFNSGSNSLTIVSPGGSFATIESVSGNGPLNIIVSPGGVPVTFESSDGTASTLKIKNFDSTWGDIIIQGSNITVGTNLSILYTNVNGAPAGAGPVVEFNVGTSLTVNGIVDVNAGATNGIDLYIQGFADSNNTLAITMGANSELIGESQGGGIQFNALSPPTFGPGPITITGPGLISAPLGSVVFNNAPGFGPVVPGAVTVNVKQIIAGGTGNDFAIAGSGSSVSITTSAGDLDFNTNTGAIFTHNGTGTSGGSISITANGGQIVSVGTPTRLVFDSRGDGSGQSGGAITLSAQSAVVLGNVNSSGTDNALPGPISVASGSGNFTILSGAAIDADTDNATNTSPHLGPLIEFQSSSPMTVVKDGTIEAVSGTTAGMPGAGRIGFNVGTGGLTTITGTGTISAGEFVHQGNLIPITDPTNPLGFVVPIPPIPPIPPTSPGASVVPVPQPAAPVFTFLPGTQDDESALFAGRIPTDFTNPLYYLEGQYEDQPGLPTTGEGLLSGVFVDSNDFNANEVIALSQAGLQGTGGSTSNGYNLNMGTAIFAPLSAITVNTRQGMLSIPAGAVVMVMAKPDGDVAVFDLHDRNSGVSLTVGGKNLDLEPGQEVLVTDNQTADFDALDRGSRIGHRHVTAERLDNGKQAFATDFSITTASGVVKPLRELMVSQNPKERAIAHAILKDAVLLYEMTSAEGAYTSSTSRLDQ